jgi:hypothetical protein
MLESMGWGWLFTLIGLNMVVALPTLGLVYVKGPNWRMAKRVGEKEG